MNVWAAVTNLPNLASQRSAAAAVSAVLSVQRMSRCFVWRDDDGDWLTWQRELKLYSPTPNTKRFRDVLSEPLDLWCRGRAIRSGGTVVDVGAGVGDDLVAFSRMVGPGGRVIAIEAHPVTFRCLQKTIRANALSNVTAVQVAVGEGDGTVLIDDGESHLSSRVGARGTSVPQRSLDALLAELGVTQVDLLKVNIEGAEWPALRGMRRTFASVTELVVSCHDFIADAGGPSELRTFAAVTGFLRAEGFQIETRSEDPRPWVRYYCYARAGSAVSP